MSKSQYLMLSVAGVIIASSAYVHGVYTDRWGRQQSEKLRQYSARLEAVPTSFGDWTSVPQEVDPEQFKASGCDASFSRLFENSVTGEKVSVFLVSGRGYHITIHTPNFCYKAAGYDMRANPAGYEFETPGMPEKNEVVHAVFKKVTATTTDHLRILWTYSINGPWRSPKYAKHTFGGEDAMYKLYLIRSVDGATPAIGDDPSIQFANEFLPILNQALYPTEGASAGGEVDAAG